jgi:hypothetical protein
LFTAAASFPNAVVGALPDGFEMIEEEHEDAEVVGSVTCHAVERVVEGVEEFSIDVELELFGGGVAHTDGSRIFVAWEPSDFPLDELALAFEAIHDLDLIGAAGDGAEEPVLPGGSFFVVAGGGHSEKGEGGVAEPAEAVVPVARAAEALGKRGGDGGDLTAGGTKGHGLEGDEGALDGIGVEAVVLELRGPVAPEVFGIFEGALGAEGAGIGLVRLAPGEGEPCAIALVDGELGGGVEVFSVNGNGSVKDGDCGTGDGANSVFNCRDPGDGAAVVETQGDCHGEIHAAANALDDADDVGIASGVVLADGHEVDEADGTVIVFEDGFEDKGVVAIFACGFRAFSRGGDFPVAVFLGAEQGGEAGRGGKVRPAEPVDGALAVDEGGGFAITDQSIVFDL